MTDKEFRKLKRSDLISIIYEYQKREDEFTEQIESLKSELENKNLKIEKAGSIADAVVGLNNIFETAQKTADEYLEQVRLANEDTEKKAAEIIKNAEAEAEKKAADIIEKAKKEAEQITSKAQSKSNKRKK